MRIWACPLALSGVVEEHLSPLSPGEGSGRFGLRFGPSDRLGASPLVALRIPHPQQYRHARSQRPLRSDERRRSQRVWISCAEKQRLAGRGAAPLLYHLVDEVVAGHLPVVDQMDEEMDHIEETILADPGPIISPCRTCWGSSGRCCICGGSSPRSGRRSATPGCLHAALPTCRRLAHRQAQRLCSIFQRSSSSLRYRRCHQN